MTLRDERKIEISYKIHRSCPCIFRKKSGRIIARNFGRINCCFCGGQRKELIIPQIFGGDNCRMDAVLKGSNLFFRQRGGEILLISGGASGMLQLAREMPRTLPTLPNNSVYGETV